MPRSVAVVGASPENFATFAGFTVIALLDAGFPAVYPVNPRYQEAFGLPCYANVSSIPGTVDHVIVCIPAEKALDVLDDCAAKHVKSVHFFTAGFSESGESERVELEAVMLSKARAAGIRIIGPNCTGLFIPKARLTCATRLPLEPGPVAFLSQSGGHAQDLPLHAGPRGVRFSKVVSYGNALDIGECELLEYFTDDPETGIIAAYIEGVRDGERFKKALRRASRKKPVIIYKGGITETGLRSARSHTASMTSSVQVFQALCRQENAIQVDDVQEMIDAIVALSFAVPYPQGTGIAVIGQGGGPSVQASDQLESAGLALPAIPPQIEAELRQFLPMAGAIYTNPLDATNLVFPQAIGETIEVLGKVDQIHMMMYHMGFHPVSRWGEGRFSDDWFGRPMVEALHNAVAKIKKPVILALGPASDRAGMEEFLTVRETLVGAKLPVFYSIDKAALAMARVESWNRRRGSAGVS
ncbi:MAG: CoA-binding protein [Dehalococcoidia bacterium]|nr:CoA-binding protein [Dehalococcoidia bacterium]MDD5494414.1 CoA-binding protein [Dehalococcoidia bacterium]